MSDAGTKPSRAFARPSPRRAALIYVLLAGSWILLSDWVAFLLLPDDRLLKNIGKGLFFVGITALILHRVLLSEHRKEAAIRRRLAGSRKRAGDLYHASALKEEQLRAVFESAPAAIVTLGRDGAVKSWNAGAERIFGWSAREVIDGPVPFIPRDAEPEFNANLDRVFAGEQLRSRRIIRRTKSGEKVALSLNAAPLRNAAGAVVGLVAIFEDLSLKERTEQRLVQLATYDTLTGLLNRASFQEYLAGLVAEADAMSETFALLYLDLDDFKTINDSLGHDAGDLLLRAMAGRLGHLLRTGDLVGRLGGDEFAVILRNLSATEDAAHFAERMLAGLSSPFEVRGHELSITTSVGIAIFPADGAAPEVLLKCADMAMYEAKRRGRHTWAAFSVRLAESARLRQELEASLHRALARGEFSLHYQPQLDLRTGNAVAVEALLRWMSPERGNVPPAAFIPVAEAKGLIRPIGRWVVEEALRFAQRRAEAGKPPLRVAVNLSFAQFTDPNLAETLSAAVKAAGLPAETMELELTESMLSSDPEQALAILGQLRAAGFQIAIDDFGTGYSSLAYLKAFQVDRLKIDRSFVQDLPGNATSAAIVRASVALAHSLGIRVIAEGVETPEQLAFLIDEGCDEAQGYHFGKPVAEDDLGAVAKDDE